MSSMSGPCTLRGTSSLDTVTSANDEPTAPPADDNCTDTGFNNIFPLGDGTSTPSTFIPDPTPGLGLFTTATAIDSSYFLSSVTPQVLSSILHRPEHPSTPRYELYPGPTITTYTPYPEGAGDMYLTPPGCFSDGSEAHPPECARGIGMEWVQHPWDRKYTLAEAGSRYLWDEVKGTWTLVEGSMIELIETWKEWEEEQPAMGELVSDDNQDGDENGNGNADEVDEEDVVVVRNNAVIAYGGDEDKENYYVGDKMPKDEEED